MEYIILQYLGYFKCLDFAGVPDVRSSTQVDERPAPVHCRRGSSHLLPQNPLLELVILFVNKLQCLCQDLSDGSRALHVYRGGGYGKGRILKIGAKW